ncbi:class I SAM-dependent RNA methyltransferase [Candidatus Gracilibacteria bacterium]|nr:class I SAM-dependent RNA methyltransferase [Candidatus Gracilibacteria bacterium]
MNFALSTSAGMEALAKTEVKKQGGKLGETIDRLVQFSGNEDLIAKVNLWSRVGNKLYIALGEKENVTTFDELFDFVSEIDWGKYFKNKHPILIRSSSVRSELFSDRTIQSICKKAVVKSLVGEGQFFDENEKLEKMDILILIINNKARILLNTSGNALHMRGYRKESGSAPIKESLASFLVSSSNWLFKDNFYDPFCGSGTIVIEAAMQAKNIAPGLHRNFAFEWLDLIDPKILETEKNLARKKIYDGDYKIFASDNNPEILEIAKNNAKLAGVDDVIKFEQKDFKKLLNEKLSGNLVSNPPYGERIKVEDLNEMYGNIDKLFRKNPELKGGIISSFFDFDYLTKRDFYKKRKLYNGGEKCYFWKKRV